MIGEKMRNLSKDPVKFNDLYYSRLMKIKCDGDESKNTFLHKKQFKKL